MYDQDRAHQTKRGFVSKSMHHVGIGLGDDTTLDKLIELVRNDNQLAATLSTLHSYDDLQRLNMRQLSDKATTLISAIEERE